MLLNILPSHNSKFDCFDDLIVMASNFFKRDFELSFAGSWGFDFKPKNMDYETIGDRLNPNIIDYLILLAQYHGIKVDWFENLIIDQFFSIIEKELSERKPTIVLLDSFWCPWNIEYMKAHFTHAFLVVGMDESTKCLYCSDGFFNKNNVYLPVDHLINGYEKCATFVLEENISFDNDWKKIINTAINNLNISKAFTSMRLFSEDIANCLDLSKEVDGFEKFWTAPLYSQLGHISKGRLLFTLTLEYLGRIYNISKFTKLSYKMEQAGKNWSTIRTILVKMFHMSNNNIDLASLTTRINAAADFEETLAMDLIKIEENGYIYFLNKNQQKNSSNLCNTIGETNFVDLTDYYNNQGFGSSLSLDCKADLTGTGHYFLVDNLPQGQDWQIGDLKFRFPHLAEGLLDNISCLNQVIKIQPNCYTSIFLLGCAEWGSFEETILIKYNNGETEEVSFGFSDWAIIPQYNETIVWTGKCVEKNITKGIVKILPSSVKLYSQKIYLKHNKVIEYIVVPDCPNIHIFAISLNI
jgi:hypothetical protein